MVIDLSILRDTLKTCHCMVWWVNNNHMCADSLTKLSEKARMDLLYTVLSTCRFRVSYCEVSGRHDTANKQKKKSSDAPIYFVGTFGSDDEQPPGAAEMDDDDDLNTESDEADALDYKDEAGADAVDDWYQD